jgi:hypothetical protein
MPGKPPSPGVAALFGAGDVTDVYLTLNRGRIFLLTTHRQRTRSTKLTRGNWENCAG